MTPWAKHLLHSLTPDFRRPEPTQSQTKRLTSLQARALHEKNQKRKHENCQKSMDRPVSLEYAGVNRKDPIINKVEGED